MKRTSGAGAAAESVGNAARPCSKRSSTRASFSSPKLASLSNRSKAAAPDGETREVGRYLNPNDSYFCRVQALHIGASGDAGSAMVTLRICAS